MVEILANEEIMRNGYKVIYLPEHKHSDSSGCVYEHIIVAEKMLGRDLKDGECVHHKDEVKSNNDPSNLMVFKTVGDHTAYHNGSSIKLDGDVWVAIDNANTICPDCGGTKYYLASYCSTCFHKRTRKVIRPSKDELTHLLANNSYCAVGRMFGVSDNTIRKWLKSY